MGEKHLLVVGEDQGETNGLHFLLHNPSIPAQSARFFSPQGPGLVWSGLVFSRKYLFQFQLPASLSLSKSLKKTTNPNLLTLPTLS